MKTKTWAPLFSGFYGTIWESEGMEENELYDINQQRLDKGLKAVEWDDLEFDYDEYTATVSKMFVVAMEGDLEERGLVKSFKFEKLSSPREYNFRNDSIHVEVTFTKKNLEAISQYLSEHKAAFNKYIKDTYSSYDGFFSSYSNSGDVWLAEGIDELMGHEHKAGAVLQFILEHEGVEEMEYYEHVTSNGGTLGASNYPELVKA